MDDEAAMSRALDVGGSVRASAHPNPWVGAVVEPGGYTGATAPPGGPHAEANALAAAGRDASGGTLYVTLEPCCAFEGKRTAPCVEAIVSSGVRRVVVATQDSDPRVAGRGIAALRAAGVEVTVGVCEAEARRQLAPYLHHRATGRPYVVLKLACTLDGWTAAPDGSSRWITGEEARADVHRLRAESDAVLVGAGTVRADDPELTVRLVEGRDPLRVVLGRAPAGARVLPALEREGDLEHVLDDLGRRGAVQLLVEGGALVAGELHRRRLVDRYVLYLAPALGGGTGGRPLFDGEGASTIDDLWRGSVVDVARIGPDVRVTLERAAA